MIILNRIEELSHKIIKEAILQQASDIHFCPDKQKVIVYYRVLGNRKPEMTIPLMDYIPLLSYYKFTSGMDIGETRKPQNGVFSFQDYQEYSLRLSTLPIHSSESLAIRILPQQQVPNLEQLFLFPNQVNKLTKLMSHQSGIILFTGPTGSGKTTTLYAILQKLLFERSVQTITLEDPIEKSLSDILQVQVNEKAGISYDIGLKAALRHDPDILMVGEIRDKKTAEFAFHAAHTGHIVLSTLHARDAYGTLFRLREMGIKQTDLTQTLIAVASQQLVSLNVANKYASGINARRVALLEILDGVLLEEAIQGSPPFNNPGYNSFIKLRRKAYALGYTEAT